jgi:hypothetical protein
MLHEWAIRARCQRVLLGVTNLSSSVLNVGWSFVCVVVNTTAYTRWEHAEIPSDVGPAADGFNGRVLEFSYVEGGDGRHGHGTYLTFC